MKLKTLIVAFAVAAVLPMAALADPAAPSDKANGARACQALKTSLGEATFKTTYGTNADKSNAMGQCVSKWTRGEHQNRHEASTACTAEQADANFAATHGGKTFAQFYGTTNANVKGNGNAFGKCVAQKASTKTAAQQTVEVKAAKTCRTDAMKAATGEGKLYRNFGACVAAHSKKG